MIVRVRKNYIVKCGRTFFKEETIIPDNFVDEVLKTQGHKVEVVPDTKEKVTEIKDVVSNKAMGKEKIKVK